MANGTKILATNGDLALEQYLSSGEVVVTDRAHKMASDCLHHTEVDAILADPSTMRDVELLALVTVGV